MVRDTRLIERLDQMEALTSPVRQEIMDALAASGRATIRELGEQLGRRPDALYYHMRLLAKVGLVQSVPGRLDGPGRPGGPGGPDARRDETVFAVRANPVRARLDRVDPRQIATMQKLVRAMLRLTSRDLETALASGRVHFEGAARNAGALRMKGWLDEERLDEALHLLDRLMQLFRGRRRPGKGALYAVTWSLVPIEARRRHGGRKRDA